MFRTLTIAAVAAASIAGAASAEGYIGFQGTTLGSSSFVELDTVTTNAAGTLEIYDFHGGQQGALLGTQDLHAGANSDVRVNVNGMTSDSVIAVVNVAGQVVDTLELDVNR